MFPTFVDTILRLYCLRKSSAFIWFLRRKGVKIGTACVFYNPKKTLVDLTRPYLLEIGNCVKIAEGCTILTHGFEWCVLREVYGRPFGGCAKVTIGDNVFIGMHATILKGVNIGSNVIIGAGSVVSRDIPDNTVAAGNPAKSLMSLEEYYQKIITREWSEAKGQAKAYFECYGREPNEDIFFKSYFFLFLERSLSNFPAEVKHQVGCHWEKFLHSKPFFPSYRDFLEACFKDETGKFKEREPRRVNHAE